MSDGTVRLADKQPKDGERVRVRLWSHDEPDTWLRPRTLAFRDEGQGARWVYASGQEGTADARDLWKPMGASDE